MLIAENSLGEKINISTLTHETIEMNRQHKWYCPGCKEEVVIKNGEVMRPHFAHKSLLNCFLYTENESEEHLKGKEIIATNCEAFDIPYELEAYLPKLKQRPDVLIKNKLAIEFQCSSLSIERFNERTQSYLDNGYQVIWIVGKQFQLKKQLSALQKHFLYLSFEKGFYLWNLDIIEESLTLIYFIIKRPQGLCFKQKSWPLSDRSLLAIFSEVSQKNQTEKLINPYQRSYQLQVERWNQQLNQKQPKVMRLQAFFYENGENMRELNAYYFYPSFLTPVYMEEELFIRLVVYRYFKEHQTGTMGEILSFVKEKLEEKLSVYVLIGEEKLLIYCISLYLSFLAQQGKVIKRKETFYVVDKVENYSECHQEILWLPLKYVMINK